MHMHMHTALKQYIHMCRQVGNLEMGSIRTNQWLWLSHMPIRQSPMRWEMVHMQLEIASGQNLPWIS
jgi:hypothetical protein